MKAPTTAVPALELRRRESVRQGLLRIAQAYLEIGRAQPRRPASELPAAVHASRLVLKRFRALYRLLAPSLPDALVQRQRRQLRRAAEALAPAREHAVAVDTLAALAASATPKDAAILARIRDSLAHGKTRQPRIASVTKTAVAQATRAQEAAVRALARKRWEEHGWKVLAAGLGAGFRRARRRFKAAQADGSSEAFHAWRIAAKSLFYQLHLVQAASALRLRALSKNLDRIQDQLGLEHDLTVLGDLLHKLAKGSGAPKAEIARARQLLANRQARLRKLALKDGRRVFAQRPRPFVERLHAEWKRWRR